MDGSEVTQLDFWLRIGLAVLCGGIIGLERQLRGKPAGIRTNTLICLGTLTYIRVSLSAFDGSYEETARVLAQVVSGIGFLGAGVILSKDGLIIGMTSAATIWILAAIGACIAYDHYGMALATTFVALLVLVGIEQLEYTSNKFRRGVHAHLKMSSKTGQAPSGHESD